MNGHAAHFLYKVETLLNNAFKYFLWHFVKEVNERLLVSSYFHIQEIAMENRSKCVSHMVWK